MEYGMPLRSLLNALPPRSRLYLATAVYGVAGGSIAVLFHQCIHLLYSNTFEAWAHLTPLAFAWRTLALMLGTSLIAGLLVARVCPAAAGSGIPQMKLAFWTNFGWGEIRMVWVKFVAGALTIGGGMSLGREGPSVQMASVISSGLARWLGVAKQKHRMPSAAGAAAGLAAAFNTPLAAVTFVLEEIIGDLNSRFLGNMLMASLLGALVAHGLLGAQPAFRVDLPNEPGWHVFIMVPFAATLATFVGLSFQWSSLWIRSRIRVQRVFPTWLTPACAALFTWAVGFSVWKYTGRLGVFSLGYSDLSDALSGELAWKIAALLLVTKFAATVVCYAFGSCGGVFAPTLFFGGMAGLTAAGLGGLVMSISGPDQAVLAVVGMCACLGAVVRAPVTGILIVFEMTHQFSLVLPLMLGALISQAISRRLAPANFYDALLEQDGHHLTRIIPPRDLESWQQLPVSAIANFHPIVLPDLKTSTLRDAFNKHTFSCFPWVEAGRLCGIITRREMEQSLITGSEAQPSEFTTASPKEDIRTIQSRLITTKTGMLVICDSKENVLGVVTLHDLLRAQMAYGESVAG